MGILNFIGFKSKSKHQPKLDLSWLQADMHSHLIPGIDDGAKNMEQSVALIKRLHGFGLKKIITTPHIMYEFYKNDPKIIQDGLTKVKIALQNEGIDIEIFAAAEYYIDEIFYENVKHDAELLTIKDNLILVETGFINKPALLIDTLFELEMKGYQPILAHPERYQYLLSDRSLQGELIDRGIYFQLNLLSLTGFYSKEVKHFAEKLVDEGRIKLLGTDCHNMRYLDMLETLSSSKYYQKIQTLDLLNTSL
ncbi:tyrosine-protein phosphatase [Belliella kenyensis]|uniref:protein-tyrosine-phosphatase n=1 Tax=Belliella kenyensis TaxID=1472724 RepID=A0ABV8EMN4_9BACT|nr:CpsB/CapC family capsule biosynthesis tyrosine phosphatase [Belliella kenyensis]MCH7401626.1 capsular biosynthesis protein [Belliella kenyensis]MDN3603096.1 capsular biosynthesis protein [Belliella kenyensis]